MKSFEILRHRQHVQLLTTKHFEKPEDVVGWFGAMQAQDYLGALWAIGLRMKGATEQLVEQAVREGKIIRSWPMRGTLHFVLPQDLRWMLALLAPRMIQRGWTQYRQASLDVKTFSKAGDILTRTLQGGKNLTRPALYAALEAKKIATGDQRGLHILGYLAQHGLICIGPRQGKQHTFALLDEWAPAKSTLTREESLARLAKLYFQSHGPATQDDFAWWSGLTKKEASESMALADDLKSFVAGDETFWYFPIHQQPAAPISFLMPAYDEYTVAYKDRSLVIETKIARKAGNGIFNPAIVYKGKIIGSWQRAIQKDKVVFQQQTFAPLTPSQKKDVTTAQKLYSKFLAEK